MHVKKIGRNWKVIEKYTAGYNIHIGTNPECELIRTHAWEAEPDGEGVGDLPTTSGELRPDSKNTRYYVPSPFHIPSLLSAVNMVDVKLKPGNMALQVVVRARPLTAAEKRHGCKDIIQVQDGRLVYVLDPDEEKQYLDRIQHRTKEKSYAFDKAFSVEASNKEVYDQSVKPLIQGVAKGLSSTIFAYGATGRHGLWWAEPGLVVLSFLDLFSTVSTRNIDGQE